MSKFKAPDLSAPRFRANATNVLNRKLFNTFLKKYSKYKDKMDLSEFKDIVRTFNNNMLVYSVENRDGIELPESLGYLVIAKCDKAKGPNPDHKASIKYKQIVNHRNWDSDNYLAKICYSNYSLKYRFSDRELWGFKPGKQYRQTVSKSFPEMYQNYIHLTKRTRLSKLYKNT